MDVGDATRTRLSRALLLHYLRRCRVTLHYVILKIDATAEGVAPDVVMSPSPPSTPFLVWMSGNRHRVDSTGGLGTGILLRGCMEDPIHVEWLRSVFAAYDVEYLPRTSQAQLEVM